MSSRIFFEGDSTGLRAVPSQILIMMGVVRFVPKFEQDCLDGAPVPGSVRRTIPARSPETRRVTPKPPKLFRNISETRCLVRTACSKCRNFYVLQNFEGFEVNCQNLT